MADVIRVTGAWLGLLSDWLDHEGLPAPVLRAEIARWAQADVVPLPVWHQLLGDTAALRPGVGSLLAIGARVKPRHVGVLGYLVLASRTLAEALAAYQRYEGLFYGASLAEVSIRDDVVDISWPVQALQAHPLHDPVGLSALVTFMRAQVADPQPPAAVAFATRPAELGAGEAEAQAVFDAFFGCRVQFGAARTGVRFPLHYLSLPLLHSDPGLRLLLDQQAAAMLQAMPDADAFDRALQQTLLRMLPEGEAAVARVADAMHVSVRTLQRRLEVRGQTWQQMLDRSREELARQYLGDRGLSLSDIALLLGFSEQSAFTRAFRRWTGETPVQVRKRLRQSGAADPA